MTPEEVRARIRRIEFREVMRRIRLPAGGIALDVGCAAGVQAEMLRDRFRLVVGLDIRLPPEARGRATLVRASADRLPFRDGVFDLVNTSNVVSHLPDRDRSMWEMKRVRRPGGLMVHTVPTPFWILLTAWTSLRLAWKANAGRGRLLWILKGETEGCYRTRREEMMAYRLCSWIRFFRRFGLRARPVPMPLLYGRPEIALRFSRALFGIRSATAFRM